ncbi:hypothetical protein [Streptomyces sp. NBC_00878]|uniref:hypothetical protein n=1 Tax=Streptomyces sp. NBC_00878 TaxID=2975854 RepID=UPI00224FA799|nr:hypothetical protein [Streptomyces sp. NBC_00878]MCX4908863.1 hypothetical protein [Streptomyces sp. NBC_00878]
MRTARPPTGTALAVAVAAVGLAAAPAYGVDVDMGSMGSGSMGSGSMGSGSIGSGSIELYPASVAPGAEVTVNTAACGAVDAVSGDAGAVGAGAFTLLPSPHEGDAVGHFRVPASAQPGTYEIVARCANGSGTRMASDLVVTVTSTRESGQQVHPRGSVKTGVGGGLGPDPVQTAAGVAALAVAAAGGTWLLHRRARGDGI